MFSTTACLDQTPPTTDDEPTTSDGKADGASCRAIDLGSRVAPQYWGIFDPPLATAPLATQPDAWRGTCSKPGTRGEVSFVWKAPWTGDFQVFAFADQFATLMAIERGTCGGLELACQTAVEGKGALVGLRLQEGERITIRVESAGAIVDSDVEIKVLSIGDEAHFCTDGIDNDGDDKADCEDPDCAATCAPQPPERCGPTICGPGTTCCNPLAGICVEPDQLCTS